jgi:hypothetical protein
MTTSVNTNPIFTKSGSINTGKTVATANIAKDGTGTVVTVFDPQRSVASITSSGTTATSTTTDPHGFLDGEQILITGAGEAGYNGVKTITLTGPKSFTYSVTAGLGTPATGTIVADPINGTRITKLVWQPIGTNVATAGRAFLNNGQSNTVATNNIYLDDVTLPISTLSEVATMPGVEMPLDIVVPPFHKINVTVGTTVAAGYAVYAVAGSY